MLTSRRCCKSCFPIELCLCYGMVYCSDWNPWHQNENCCHILITWHCLKQQHFRTCCSWCISKSESKLLFRWSAKHIASISRLRLFSLPLKSVLVESLPLTCSDSSVCKSRHHKRLIQWKETSLRQLCLRVFTCIYVMRWHLDSIVYRTLPSDARLSERKGPWKRYRWSPMACNVPSTSSSTSHSWISNAVKLCILIPFCHTSTLQNFSLIA